MHTGKNTSQFELYCTQPIWTCPALSGCYNIFILSPQSHKLLGSGSVMARKELPLTGRWNNSCTPASNHNLAFCSEKDILFQVPKSSNVGEKGCNTMTDASPPDHQNRMKNSRKKNPQQNTKKNPNNNNKTKNQTKPRLEAQRCTTSVCVLFSEGAKEAEAQQAMIFTLFTTEGICRIMQIHSGSLRAVVEG